MTREFRRLDTSDLENEDLEKLKVIVDGVVMYKKPKGGLETWDEREKRLGHNSYMKFSRSFDGLVWWKNSVDFFHQKYVVKYFLSWNTDYWVHGMMYETVTQENFQQLLLKRQQGGSTVACNNCLFVFLAAQVIFGLGIPNQTIVLFYNHLILLRPTPLTLLVWRLVECRGWLDQEHHLL